MISGLSGRCERRAILYLDLDSTELSGKLGSLLLCGVGIGNEISLEDLSPEAGQLMAVVDLDNVELLKDAAVESHLVSLEARKYLAAEIEAHDVIELTLSL